MKKGYKQMKLSSSEFISISLLVSRHQLRNTLTCERVCGACGLVRRGQYGKRVCPITTATSHILIHDMYLYICYPNGGVTSVLVCLCSDLDIRAASAQSPRTDRCSWVVCSVQNKANDNTSFINGGASVGQSHQMECLAANRTTCSALLKEDKAP